MQNLLPSVPNKLEETLKRVDRISNWRPDDADPTMSTVDRKLLSEFTIDKLEVIKYRKPVLPKPEPNYVSQLELGSVDPSPLSAAVRAEEVEESVINMEGMKIDSGIPVFVKPKKKKVSTKFDHMLYAKFYSKMPVATDLYIQKLRTMKVMGLRPFGELLRLIEGDMKHAQFVEHNGVHLLCSPLNRSSVAMTTRREIKNYHFNKYERIGLEVEMAGGKLTCTRVIPGSQAAPHSLYLQSAEVVGINGERVLSLQEFQLAMQRAKNEKFFLGEIPDDTESSIVITVAAFKGGKSKVDDVYLHSFAQRERMKSLFSNIFSSSGGGRKVNHNDDDTSVTSADGESRDASFSITDNDSGSIYVEAAEAARKAVEEADAKDDQQSERRGSETSSIKSSPSRMKPSVYGDSVTVTRKHSRRRHLDSDDEDDAKSSSAHNDNDDNREDKDCKADEKTSSSVPPAPSKLAADSNDSDEVSTSLAAESKQDSKADDSGVMKVSAVQKSLDLWYGGDSADDDDSSRGAGMRAGRKTVQRETVAPEVAPVKEPTPPPTAAVVEEESTVEPEEPKKDLLLDDPPTILPFTSLVCIPPPLAGSIDWGLPDSYIQFTNFTTNNSWKMEIFWVDNEGSMVPRHELKSGLTHLDMCTADHVWAIIARPHYDTKAIKPVFSRSISTINQGSSVLGQDQSMSNESTVEQGAGPELVDVKQPLLMVIRPCSMALQEGKCLSIIWTPWQSLSVSHIIHPQTSKTRTKKVSIAGPDHGSHSRVQPVMHIQLFETPLKRLQVVAGQCNISNNMEAAAVQAMEGDEQSRISGNHMSDDQHSQLGDNGSVHSQHSALQPSIHSQHTTYSTLQRTLADFKAAIKASDSRYQSQRDQFDSSQGIGKLQRKPLVTTGALHRMRKDHK